MEMGKRIARMEQQRGTRKSDESEATIMQVDEEKEPQFEVEIKAAGRV